MINNFVFLSRYDHNIIEVKPQQWYNTYMETSQNNISESKFKIGFWITTHRKLIKIFYTSCVGVVAACMIGMAVFQLVDWLSHIKQTNEIMQIVSGSIVRYDAKNPPQDIQQRLATSVIHSEDSVSVVANLYNPNTIWGATKIEYEVFIGGISAGTEEITLAPLQERYITKTDLAFSGDDAPAVSIVMGDVIWKRIQRPDKLPEENWEYLNAEYDFINSEEGSLSFQTKLSLTIKNKSIWGYRQTQVVALMIDPENEIQAIDSFYIDEISSLETRDVTFFWPLKLSKDLKPTVHVNIDKLNEELIIRKLSD